MAARPSTFGNMVLALTVICLVCAALLGLVQHVTAGPIARTDQQKENAAIAAVVPAFDNEPSAEKTAVGESVVFTARSGEDIVGYAIKVRTGGFGGTLVMMVGFTLFLISSSENKFSRIKENYALLFCKQYVFHNRS